MHGSYLRDVQPTFLISTLHHVYDMHHGVRGLVKTSCNRSVIQVAFLLFPFFVVDHSLFHARAMLQGLLGPLGLSITRSLQFFRRFVSSDNTVAGNQDVNYVAALMASTNGCQLFELPTPLLPSISLSKCGTSVKGFRFTVDSLLILCPYTPCLG